MRAFLLLVCCLVIGAAEPSYEVRDLAVTGAVRGANITFTVSATIETTGPLDMVMLEGDMVLADKPTLPDGVGIDLFMCGGYELSFPRKGIYPVVLSCAARPAVLEKGEWREASFGIPASRRRELKLTGDRSDLEVVFPGALRQERTVVDGGVEMTAILGPGLPFAVRWKPRVADLDAELVFSTDSNSIVAISPGSLRLDDLILVDIAQGSLDQLSLALPDGLNVVKVDGAHIRDWRTRTVGAGRQLEISLNQQVDGRYILRVEGEQALPRFPASIDVPVIRPLDGLRSHGQLALGTDSAIQLVVDSSSGCSQIDAKAFTIKSVGGRSKRRAPAGKIFAYTFPTVDYRLRLALDQIAPSYDVQQQLAVRVGEDDARIRAMLEVDVRDAPLREVVVTVPTGVSVSEVTGGAVAVDDVQIVEEAGRIVVTVPFAKPVIGRQAFQMKLERGRSILGTEWSIPQPVVQGARSQRGYVMLAAEDGIRLNGFTPTNLRRVHAASVPVALSGGQYAYRFRNVDWQLGLLADRKTSTVRAESFHLIGIGEGMCYGNVVVNYVIAGAPVDTLTFRIDPRLRGIEFVGTDVTRAVEADGVWTVHLRRKVIGDYNLGIVFNQPLGEDEHLPIGGIATEGIDGETGWLVLASRRNVHLGEAVEAPGLVPIAPEELPATYRLLVGAPILQAWAFVGPPPTADAKLDDGSTTTPLSALVEMLDLRTQLSIREDGTVESHTKASYKVKNARAQFVDLQLPEGARAWGAVHILDGDGNRKRATVSSGADGSLKVQLTRTANPNEPLTIEVEYGQSHGAVADGRSLALQAPLADLVCSYLSWQVQSHDGWSLQAVPGDMEIAEREPIRIRGLTDLLPHVAVGWFIALYHATSNVLPWLIVGIGLLAAGVVALRQRRWLVPTISLVVLSVLLVIGIDAARRVSAVQLDAVVSETTIDASRALELASDAPPVLALRIVPSIWQDAGMGLVVCAWVLTACLIGSACMTRRWRLPIIGLAAATCAWSAGLLPVTRGLLVHAATWLPFAAGGALIIHRALGSWRPGVWVRRSAMPAVAVTLVAVLLSGCGGSGHRPPVDNGHALGIPDQVDLKITEQEDAFDVVMTIAVTTDGPQRLPVLGQGAVLVEDIDQEHVRVDLIEGVHQLVIEKPGRYTVPLHFLTPKTASKGGQHLALPMPTALRNSVALTTLTDGMRITCPTAVSFEQGTDAEGRSHATGIVGVHQEVVLDWRPRAREIAAEEPVLYAAVQALHRFDTGLVQGHHQIDYRIAQGQVQEFAVQVPKGMTVTAVDGKEIGTWRFHPGKGLLEVIRNKPVADTWSLAVTTQIRANDLPTNYAIGALQVVGAEHQRGTIGFAAANAVHLTLGEGPVRLTAADFARDATAALQAAGKPPVRYAIRNPLAGETVAVGVRAVQPELRSREQATFSISDDRLVYNGTWRIDVSKAGVFQVGLVMPASWDIDHLGSKAISHWDELVDGDQRRVVMHFPNRTQGAVPMHITLSMPVGALPERLLAPRISVIDVRKHAGQLVVSSERGVRLDIRRREGLGEKHPRDAGISDERSLVFSILKPDWALDLATEVITPLIHVEDLHVVRVTDGLVRHSHHLRWRLQHAGSKLLRIALPAGVSPDRGAGMTATGPDIADWRTTKDSDRWYVEVELTRKWFDRIYPLNLRYETRFDAAAGDFSLRPLRAEGADLTRHYLAVFANDRVELAVAEEDGGLIAADARTIPDRFGVGDLSGAAFSYRSTDADYALGLQAQRHSVADLLAAEVERVDITSVLAARGSVMTRIDMNLTVGSKRHLQIRLPEGASIWAATIDGRPVAAAADPDDNETLLLPLSRGAVDEIGMELTMVVVADGGRQGAGFRLELPRFDLPLRQVGWTVFAPDGYRYDGFTGTVNVDNDTITRPAVAAYSSEAYDQNVTHAQQQQETKAQQWVVQSKVFSDNGSQYQARMALENAYNYSLGNTDLNEDARVQLHSLNQQQALVCLVGRRGILRRDGASPTAVADDSFSSADANRVASSLQKEDFDNLRIITDRLVEAQHQAVAPAPQIGIEMPSRGRVLRFTRALQVDVDQALMVAFTSERAAVGKRWGDLGLALAIAAAVMIGLLVTGWLGQVRPASAAQLPVAEVVEPDEIDDDVVDLAATDNDLLAGIDGVPTSAEVGTDLSAPLEESDEEPAELIDDIDTETELAAADDADAIDPEAISDGDPEDDDTGDEDDEPMA